MSIRTVRTSFTSPAPSSSPSWSHSSTNSVLGNVNMNHPRSSYHSQEKKYPPGLGLNLPSALGSSPSLTPSQSVEQGRSGRRRSGSFSAGNSYPAGSNSKSNIELVPIPAQRFLPTPPSYSSRRRTAFSRLPYASPSSSRSTQDSRSGDVTIGSSPIGKFDPFADDDSPSLYLKSPPPKSHKSAPFQRASNTPYTIRLSSLSSISLPSTNKSPYYSPAPVSNVIPLAAPKPDKNVGARIVAGILLNRIYAVGKPMRRRMGCSSRNGKGYVKSSLSSVLTVEC